MVLFPGRHWRSNPVPREQPPPTPPPVAVSYDLVDSLQFQADMFVLLRFSDFVSDTLEFQTDVSVVMRMQ
jgi:hypothetical protein